MLLFASAALCIYSLDSLLIRVPSVRREQDSERLLAAAVSFDFIVIVPLLYYMLIARRQPAPHAKASALAKALPYAALGALLAWFTLPNGMHASVWIVELVLLPVEALFIGCELRYAALAYRKVRRRQAESGQSFPEALAAVLGPGKLKAYIRHDVSVLYYLLGSWKAEASSSRTTADRTFTYHRQTGLLVTVALLTKVLLFEAVVVHLLARMWSETLAWLPTLGTVWLLAMLWADCRRSVLESIRLTDDVALIRCGLRLQADIPYKLIAEVQSGREFKPAKAERRTSAETMLGTANVRIALHEPIVAEGLLFQPRRVAFIYLSLDEPEAFAAALQTRCASTE